MFIQVTVAFPEMNLSATLIVERHFKAPCPKKIPQAGTVLLVWMINYIS